jgi:catalase
MRYANPGDPVYAPNSAAGPVADPQLWQDDTYYVAGDIVRSAYEPHADDDDFVQPRALWDRVLTESDRENLVANICAHAGAPEVTTEMKSRVVEYWRNVHPELGAQVGKGLDGG